MRRGLVAVVILVAGTGLWLIAMLAPFALGGGPAPDRWRALIEVGDAAASGQVVPDGLSARAAYLLAFHEAQDALDVPRMLLAAERLERLGETAIAAHLKIVTRKAAFPPERSD
jgi:hypothetical protein